MKKIALVFAAAAAIFATVPASAQDGMMRHDHAMRSDMHHGDMHRDSMNRMMMRHRMHRGHRMMRHRRHMMMR